MKLRLLTNSMLMVFSAMLISCSFVSCGGDDEDDDNTILTSSESSKFVGYWETPITYNMRGNKGHLRFILFEEGIMRFLYDGVKECNWNYSKNTGILATTANFHDVNPQWEITIANTGSWSGLSLWKEDGTTHNVTPVNYDYAPKLILQKTKWKHESGIILEFLDRDENYIYYTITRNGSSLSSSKMKAKYVSYNSNNDELSFSLYWTFSGSDGIKFTLRHPYSRNKCEMIITESFGSEFYAGSWTLVE